MNRFFTRAASSSPPKLRLGSIAPNFTCKTTKGPLDFHKFKEGMWAILFSHPADFTPVCTTELGAVAKLSEEWKKRNVAVIGLSVNSLTDHAAWIADINETQCVSVDFPIIADAERKVATLYDMLDYQDASNVDAKGMPFTVRTVFVIDPKNTIRFNWSLVQEILRVTDSLMLSDRYRIATPADWVVGDDVIIQAGVGNEKAAKLFPGYKTVKPYLRFTEMPKSKVALNFDLGRGDKT